MMTDDIVTEEIENEFEPPRRNRRKALLLALVFLLVPLLAIGSAAVWWQHELDASGAPGPLARVTIVRGASVHSIGDLLQREGVIGSSLAFQLYARLGNHSNFQAGAYSLHRNIGVRAAVEALRKGPRVVDQILRIIPGLWLSEVASAVHRQLGLNAAKFESLVRNGAVRSKYLPAGTTSLEGLLFPDTYRIAQHATELDVIRTMVTRFDAIADSIDLAGVAASAGRRPYDVVKVASLIQGEVTIGSERPLVASVVYNRLARHMKLQIDATVLYVVGHRSASNTAADRATPSPYNTYLVDGLPPTPIATVTEASLLAALHPATTTYLYYVLIDKSGKQAFASTYAEHLRNVQLARQRGLLQ